ncbi:MAG: hypothetical protein AAB853_03135 [Patescibacteria group bacterium]
MDSPARARGFGCLGDSNNDDRRKSACEYLVTHFRLADTFSVPKQGNPVELWLHL